MAQSGKRIIVRLKSTASHYTYSTTKSTQRHPERAQWKKYDPIVRKHVLFRESK